MAIVEVTVFHCRDDADESAFVEADRDVQQLLSSAPGFVRRTTARGDNGDWLVVTMWSSARHADEAVQARADHFATRAFESQIDPSTTRTRRFETLN